MQSLRSFFTSRLSVILAAALVSVGLIVGVHTRGSVTAAWEMIGISSTSPLFSDMHTITNSIDCLNAGQDPYVVKTFDPWHRRYNYPPIWLDLRYLGITSRDTVALGLLLAASTLGAYLYLFRTRSVVNTLLAMAGILSMPALVVIERGNIDEVIFGLLIFGYILAHRLKQSNWLIGRCVLIVLMTVLKVFPIAMVGGLVRRRRGLLLAAGVAALSFAAMLLVGGHGVIHAIKNTPQDMNFSFGSFTVIVFFWHFMPAFIQHSRAALHLRTVGSACAVLTGLVTMTYGALNARRVARIVPIVESETVRGAITLACLSTYMFVFFSGASYVYRLAFLLPPLAYLLDEFSGRSIRYARLAALLLLAFLWSTSAQPPIGLERILDLIVYLSCGVWMGANLFGKQAPQAAALEQPTA